MPSYLIEATPQAARQRITQAPETMRVKLGTGSAQVPARDLFMAALAWGSRIKEIVSYVAPEERREEIRYGIYGTDLTYDTLDGEEFALFKMNILKRKMRLSRTVALPTNPDYEPFTVPLIRCVEGAGDGPVFPVNRVAAWKAARQVFDGLGYWIEAYIDPKTHRQVEGHWKPYGDHANRHLRGLELKDRFRFRKDEMQSFFRWSARFANISPQLERYVGDEWQDYAAKLIPKVERTNPSL